MLPTLQIIESESQGSYIYGVISKTTRRPSKTQRTFFCLSMESETYYFKSKKTVIRSKNEIEQLQMPKELTH